MSSAQPSRPGFWPVVRGVFLGYLLSYIALLALALLIWLIGLPSFYNGSKVHFWLWGFDSVGAGAASLVLSGLLCIPCASLVRIGVQDRIEQEISLADAWIAVAIVGLPLWQLGGHASALWSTLLTACALLGIVAARGARRPLRVAHPARVAAMVLVLAAVPVVGWGWLHPYARSGSGGLSAGGPVAEDSISISERSPLAVSVTSARVTSQTVDGIALTRVSVTGHGNRADVVLRYITNPRSCVASARHHAHIHELQLKLKTPLGATTQIVPVDETVDLTGCSRHRQ